MNKIRFFSLLLALAALPVTAGAKPDAASPVGKHDSHAPIEVTSDTLEVFQVENRAVFSGHVVAIQGDVRLKSDKMTVYYRKQDEQAAKPAKEKSAAPGPSDNAIKKIDAEGNVFLSTQEETASGTSGTYDVEHHEIHLNDNVVLTRAQNILKGDHLVYNFDTGKSVLTGGAGDSLNATASGGQGKSRVRALFVPTNGQTNSDKAQGKK